MVRSRKKMRVGHTPDRVEDPHKKKVDSLIEDQLLDDTAYGEIIPSLMGWISSEAQEQRASQLVEIAEDLTEEKKMLEKKSKKQRKDK